MEKSEGASDIQSYRREWGIPDWQKVESYGPVHEWNRKRWQWEFYRRRTVVREYFDMRANDHYDDKLAFFQVCPEAFKGRPPRRPTDAGFVVGVADEDWNEIGYMSLPNPRISAQPDMAILPCSGAAKIRPVEPPRCGCTVGELLEMFGVELSKKQQRRIKPDLQSYPVALKDGEVALVFDYNLPLEPQLRAAKSHLEDGYEWRELPKQRRAQPDKWLTYLRVLDGRAEGASWSELAAVLPKSGQQTAHNARDTWKAATDLRFNF